MSLDASSRAFSAASSAIFRSRSSRSFSACFSRNSSSSRSCFSRCLIPSIVDFSLSTPRAFAFMQSSSRS
uniref:Uncharacterized protein n=1 Tax=uncultured marine virus TaxID=186617 RepID=A0A0F7L401_9VIRU|nr:hypothetical protein [uncultured marine virus]